MIKNKKISSNINMWNIEFDAYGFSSDSNWLNNAEKTEDILQLSHIYSEGPIIGVGYYNNLYKIYVIFNTNWDNPKEEFQTENINAIMEKVYELIDKYAKGS